MAFEAFLEEGDQRPRRRRRLTYLVSLAVHAALLAGGVAYSFWHVEEITPPRVHLTFMAVAPPPPAAPPPPPAGGSSDPAKAKTPRKPKPATLTSIVQPRPDQPKKEEPRPEPDDDDPAQAFAGGTKGGSQGGTIGGTIGGTPGGTIGGTVGGAVGGTPRSMGPRKLAPQIGALQKESGDDPDFPALLRRSGRFYVVLANICVSRTGSVDSVTILQGADTLLDGNVVSAVKKWRYRPLMADSNAVPFCYFGRFEFRSN